VGGGTEKRELGVPLDAARPKTYHCDYICTLLRHSVTIFGFRSVNAVMGTE
jgi:hypothetical protein